MSGFTDLVKGALPFIGSALAGPLGGMAAEFIGAKMGLPSSTIESVTNALNGMPASDLVQMKQIELDFQTKMAALGYGTVDKINELNATLVEAVNKTMQVEATSEHWPTYSWRPFCGFVFGVMFLGVYFILPLAHIPIPLVPQEAWLSMGAVLGVASFFRGKMQADPAINSGTNTKG